MDEQRQDTVKIMELRKAHGEIVRLYGVEAYRELAAKALFRAAMDAKKLASYDKGRMPLR